MTNSSPTPAAGSQLATLSGIVPPLATPLLSDQSLDLDGAERLVEHVIAGGVSGVFLLGTCGEGNALGFRRAAEYVEHVCRAVNSRIPVLVGVSNSALADSLELSEHAADCGAAAVVATPPYYFPVDEAALTEHLRRLARRSPLPLMLYNMPSCTGNSITEDMLHALADEPSIVGLKDSSGGLQTFARLCNTARELRPDWRIFIGPEGLLADAIFIGADGGVSGGANVCPRLFVDLYTAAAQGDKSEIDRLRAQTEFLAQCYGSPVTATSVIQGLKTALGTAGICSGATSELFPPVDSDRREQITGWVEELSRRGLVTAHVG